MATTLGFADESIERTYRRMRFLVALALVFLPLLTALAGTLWGHRLQDSLSDYYFVAKDGGLPRTVFVIFLAFLGGILFSYRGLDERDNVIHNVAGLFAFAVALFPMKCITKVHPFCEPGLLPQLHGLSAGLLFVAAIVSVGYGGGPRLKAALQRLPKQEEWFARLRKIQVLSATLMAIGVFTYFFQFLFKDYLPAFSYTFWVEYLGFFGFGVYWFRLMILINDANKEGSQLPPSAPKVTPKSSSQAPAARSQPDAVVAPNEGWIPIP